MFKSVFGSFYVNTHILSRSFYPYTRKLIGLPVLTSTASSPTRHSAYLDASHRLSKTLHLYLNRFASVPSLIVILVPNRPPIHWLRVDVWLLMDFYGKFIEVLPWWRVGATYNRNRRLDIARDWLYLGFYLLRLSILHSILTSVCDGGGDGGDNHHRCSSQARFFVSRQQRRVKPKH